MFAGWVEKLSLSNKEGKRIILSKGKQSQEFWLVVKFFTKRVMNIDAVAKTFRLLWRTRQSFNIRDARNNHLMFAFEIEVDVEKVLLGEPWSFDRHLAVFQRYDGKVPMKELDFGFSKFWVQLHHLPFNLLTLEVAMDIAQTLGTVVLYEDTSKMMGGNFMQVRMLIDISQPLCRDRQVIFEDGLEGWIAFKYERLPNVCNWCGRLSHDDKDCILWLQSKGSLKTENQQFGQWLHASQFNPSKKMVIDVKGYGEDWRVRPESVQVEEQIALALPSNRVIIQNDSIGSTQVILHDDNAGSRRNREQLLVVEPTVDTLSGGCQGMVIPDACGLSNFEKSVPNFKETLQQLDKDISKDYVPPNKDSKYLVFEDVLLDSSSVDKTRDDLDTNAKLDKFPQNVGTMSGDTA